VELYNRVGVIVQALRGGRAGLFLKQLSHGFFSNTIESGTSEFNSLTVVTYDILKGRKNRPSAVFFK
jgi:hypothetical protein